MDASGGQQAPEPAAGLQAPLDLLSPPLPPAPLLPAPPSAPLDGLPEGLDDAQKQWMQQWMAQQMQTVAQQQQQQQHWQHSPSTQQTAAPPADVPQFAWPIVLERAEVQLRAIQRRKQALVKVRQESAALRSRWSPPGGRLCLRACTDTCPPFRLLCSSWPNSR